MKASDPSGAAGYVRNADVARLLRTITVLQSEEERLAEMSRVDAGQITNLADLAASAREDGEKMMRERAANLASSVKHAGGYTGPAAHAIDNLETEIRALKTGGGP